MTLTSDYLMVTSDYLCKTTVIQSFASFSVYNESISSETQPDVKVKDNKRKCPTVTVMSIITSCIVGLSSNTIELLHPHDFGQVTNLA